MSLGKRIRQRRQVLKITQQELAQALGMTPQHISAIEQDKRTPSLSFLEKASSELGVSIDFLVCGREGAAIEIASAIRSDKILSSSVKKALITIINEMRSRA